MLDLPAGLAMDKSGNIYLADENKCRIYKTTPSGITTIIAGNGKNGYTGDGGQATDATFNEPMGVAIDASGNIYVADMGNERIRKINTAGIITTIAGSSPTPGIGGFSGDGGPAIAAQLSQPMAVLADKAGNVYIGDAGNRRIRKINTSGIISTYTNAINAPTCLVFDASENMYVAGYYSNRVYKITPAGKVSVVAGNGYKGGSDFFGGGYNGDNIPATDAQLDAPLGVAVDDGGNVYITEEMNYRVRKVDPSGIITTICGTGAKSNSGDSGPAPLATLSYPFGITVDSSGNNIYVSDYTSTRVRKIDNSDRFPYFTNGKNQSLNFCHDSTPINSIIRIADMDMGGGLMWSVISKPLHGRLDTSYTATSTGGTITPSGMTYIADSSYSGSDTFTVTISDGTKSDTTTVTMFCAPVAVEKATTTVNEISISPNPSNGKFSFKFSSDTNEDVAIILRNMMGETLKELVVKSNQQTDLSLNVASGLYLISAKTGTSYYTRQVIINN